MFRLLILLILGLLVPVTVWAGSACDDWPAYRDGELFREWDRQMGRYLLSTETLSEMQNLKDAVESDGAWARTSAGLLVGTIAATVNTATHVIRDAIKILPLSMGATVAEEVGFCLIAADEDAILRGEAPSFAIVRGAAEKCLIKAAKKQLAKYGYGWVGQVNDSISAILTHVKDLQRAVKLPQEQEELRRIVTEQVNRLDALINRYQRDMRDAINRAGDLNQFKERMDTICAGSSVDRLMLGAWGFRANSPLECITRSDEGLMVLDKKTGQGSYSGTRRVRTTMRLHPGCYWTPESKALGARHGSNTYAVDFTHSVVVTVTGTRVLVRYGEKMPIETRLVTYEYVLQGTMFSNVDSSYTKR